jgi:hypothetical protein
MVSCTGWEWNHSSHCMELTVLDTACVYFFPQFELFRCGYSYLYFQWSKKPSVAGPHYVPAHKVAGCNNINMCQRWTIDHRRPASLHPSSFPISQGMNPILGGTIFVMDGASVCTRTAAHQIFKRPHCGHCGRCSFLVHFFELFTNEFTI